MASSRYEVYSVIDKERDYQDKRWGKGGSKHEVSTWISYMEYHLSLAKKASATTAYTGFPAPGLDEIRKVVALGVACLEDAGVPERRIHNVP